MATNTLNTRIIICSKTTAQWADITTVPLKGEMCIEWVSETDSNGTVNTLPKIKIGDGTNTYPHLPYATFTEQEIKSFISQAAFDLQPATSSVLGGVKIGTNVGVAADGTISIPTASAISASAGTAGVMSVADKYKLNNIASGAEVNQNAFSNVKVGSTTVSADTKTDTLELVAGSNVTLTPDDTNDKITIAATDTTYSNATTSAAGLMSSDDKTKLNGIETGADVTKIYARGTVNNPDTESYINTNGFIHINNATVTDEIKQIDGASRNGVAFTINDATTSQKGIVQLNSATNSTSTSQAATPSAVKSAYDLANAAMPKSGGTFTGAVTLNADPTANLGAATKQYVDNQISTAVGASDAMVFKGTLGTGGTVTAVPTTGVVKGDTYKVITAGSWAGSTCKVGDLLIALNSGSVTANTTNWAYVPSGNENETTIKYSTTTQSLTTSAQTGAITVGEAATKQVDTSISAASTSTKLPTSQAVASFVEGKGYLTSSGTIANATNATNATQLANSRNFSITGGATAAAVSFNGTQNVALNITNVSTSVLAVPSGDTLVLDGNFT